MSLMNYHKDGTTFIGKYRRVLESFSPMKSPVDKIRLVLRKETKGTVKNEF